MRQMLSLFIACVFFSCFCFYSALLPWARNRQAGRGRGMAVRKVYERHAVHARQPWRHVAVCEQHCCMRCCHGMLAGGKVVESGHETGRAPAMRAEPMYTATVGKESACSSQEKKKKRRKPAHLCNVCAGKCRDRSARSDLFMPIAQR